MKSVARDLQNLFDVGAAGTLPDAQLLERFLDRREGGVFEAIVVRHGPMVWGVCRRVLQDHHDAEDAFQATFLVLTRKAPSVRPREMLGNWLYGVAYQTAMKARAARARRRSREGQAAHFPEPAAAPEVPRDERAEALDRELSRLPEMYRVVIVLCDLQGRSHREAAGRLGWPIGTVSSRLSRGRAMLARRLSRCGLSLPVVLPRGPASAAVPPRLVGATTEAARWFVAGECIKAGVVSAEVVVLTEEVFRVMLLGKLRAGVGALLVASTLTAATTGLAFQARGTESGTKAAVGTGLPFDARAFRPGDGTGQQPGDIHNPIAGAKDELQQLIDKEQKVGGLVSQKKKELQQLIDQQAKLRDLLSEKKEELQRLVERQAKEGQGTGDKKPDSPGLRKFRDLVSQKKKELQQLIDQQAEEEQRAHDKGTTSEER